MSRILQWLFSLWRRIRGYRKADAPFSSRYTTVTTTSTPSVPTPSSDTTWQKHATIWKKGFTPRLFGTFKPLAPLYMGRNHKRIYL